jgi:hypothetical protein
VFLFEKAGNDSAAHSFVLGQEESLTTALLPDLVISLEEVFSDE